MKHILTIAILLCCSSLFAQSGKNPILGNWVKTKVEYKNGEELSDEVAIKYSYQRYSFEKPNKAFFASTYDSKGMAFTFTVTNNLLQLQNSYGYLVNSFLIEKQTEDELVLLQKGRTGFESPDCIRYYYIAEEKYQNAIPLKSSDVLAVNGTDTLYTASPKVYAKFNANDDFHDFLTSNMPAFNNYTSTDNFFLASFIVRKTGELDSLQILESINPTFDKQFTKAFNKTKGKWQPATLNGKNVDVRMQKQFRFVSSRNFLPSYDFSNKGKEAMKAKEYLKALYYFDMGLASLPSNTDMLYQRAVCKIQLGNLEAACEDLQKLRALGNTSADVLISTTCKR